MSVALGFLSIALIWLAAVVAVFTDALPHGSAPWWLATAGSVAGWASLVGYGLRWAVRRVRREAQP